MIRPEFIVEELIKYMPDANLDMVWQAYAFAARCHKGQKRVSGEPYLNHPLEVSYILAQMKLGYISITAGLLHDTIEDTFATEKEIREMFGEEVWGLVDGVTKLSLIESSTMEERQAENVRKMILAMSKDIRVILIKLADRIHNMRTLDYLKPAKQKRVAQETLDIYAPLANRLGMGWIKTELENLSFKYLHPVEYSKIKHSVAEHEQEREEYIASIAREIEEKLKDEGVKVTVEARSKHLFSIYSKMEKQKIGLDEVYDLLGVRIITNTDIECYTALGLIHSMYKPIPGKFDDYIGIPKENMYQSLHTTVVGPEGKAVEIQIRSIRMHHISEEGIAAHWRYKTDGAQEGKHDDQIIWLRRLLDWQKEVKNPKEFLEFVKIDLYPDEVYVFTPKQDVKALPKGATPIDFAYAIHTDLGHNLIGAKINGKLASLRHELKNGDIVEILKSAQQHPSRDWLKYVKTSKARTKIGAYIRQAERSRAHDLGKELLEKELLKIKLVPDDYLNDKKLLPYAQTVGYTSLESFFVAIGFGKIKSHQVVRKIAPKEALKKEGKVSITGAIKKLIIRSRRPEKLAGIRIQGMDDMLIRFAHCCDPVPGDKIRGFVSRGRGLIIHTEDCPNAMSFSMDSDRYVAVDWDVKGKEKHLVMISVETEDRTGMLAAVSTAISDLGANITDATIRTDIKKKGSIYISVEIANLSQLQDIMKAVLKQKGVKRVQRVRDRRAFMAARTRGK
ncbi:Guanosine-3',5'-bis(diphosphate) 3'-pyrophosphohydrolase / GTP pyrophosphokinase, (p)ppGpp synthetase II [hydrothermal vent metagenome]|uniref:Guanosine-3',5'-bis(Diphosphate) 3'-pyrophosphohydrolase / GTP pyrophosphokinase, (P)ppGpp synthetase II n=1 Tax=hydrothermal vent metagenome TaxID=652676 RepID=A0A3B1C2S1_9ZZZZ